MVEMSMQDICDYEFLGFRKIFAVTVYLMLLVFKIIAEELYMKEYQYYFLVILRK